MTPGTRSAFRSSSRSRPFGTPTKIPRDIIASELRTLVPGELQAIWLTTETGADRLLAAEETGGGDETAPVDLDDVTEVLLQRILGRAADWSNRRIRAYLRRQAEVD